MKKALIAAASLAAFAAFVPAAAQAEGAAPAGAYVNLDVGIADMDGADIWALQGRLGYRFNQWVAVEGELGTGLSGDDIDVSGVDVHVSLKHQLAAYVVGFVPVGENTDLMARIGYGASKIKASALGVSDSDSEDSVNYGVGVQHHFDGVNGVRADFTRHDFNDGGGHADVWTIGYSRRF